MSHLRPARLFVALFATLTALAALLLAPTAPAGAGPVLMPGASLEHPFSNPVWWPLRTETKFDCYSGNPGCTSPLYHTTWLMDVVSTDYSTTRPHEPVYAMGAGILHYGVSSDVKCGGTIPHSRGDWIWIDHGNGTLSWYGHLAWPFLVPNGAYVTPKTQIALIGNSGYSNCKKYPTLHYIDIAVKHGATNGQNNGTYYQVLHTSACVRGVQQVWPDNINRNWRKWNDVPKSPRGNEHIIPASDADSSCIPDVPATPDRTTSVRLARSGTDQLRASWALPSTGAARSSIVVLIYEYHPSINRWLELRKHLLPATRTTTIFTGLHHNHTFRVAVTFQNSAGNSAASPLVSAVAR